MAPVSIYWATIDDGVCQLHCAQQGPYALADVLVEIAERYGLNAAPDECAPAALISAPEGSAMAPALSVG